MHPLPLALIASLPIASLLAALPAQAATKACLTSIKGQEIALAYDSADPALRDNRSTRERLFGGYGRITCPGFVTLRQMTPGITDDQRGPFCLTFDATAGTYDGFAVADRDGWLECKAPPRTICQHVNATAETARTVTTAIAQAALAPAPAEPAEGSPLLDAASGALILSGAGSYITSTLGAAASSALAALSAPGVATAAAITVVAVGGAVYVCN